MKIEDDLAHVMTDQPADDALRERRTCNWYGRLGPDERQRSQSRTESGREDEGVRQMMPVQPMGCLRASDGGAVRLAGRALVTATV